jgi:hypothetical protein
MSKTDDQDLEKWMADIASDMKRVAQYGYHTGRLESPERIRYFKRCHAVDAETGSSLIFTRDAGMHTSGWWKNPDYERCLHLSLSFFEVEAGFRDLGGSRVEPAALKSKDRRLTEKWLELFFGELRRYIWAEPPFSEEGKLRDVWHYRVFVMTPTWNIPMLPRDEVYTKELTAAGWLSYSDLRHEQQESAHT